MDREFRVTSKRGRGGDISAVRFSMVLCPNLSSYLQTPNRVMEGHTSERVGIVQALANRVISQRRSGLAFAAQARANQMGRRVL